MKNLNLTEEQKQKLQQAAETADQQTDNLLVKIGKSKWSWVIVLGILAAAWLLGFIQK